MTDNNWWGQKSAGNVAGGEGGSRVRGHLIPMRAASLVPAPRRVRSSPQDDDRAHLPRLVRRTKTVPRVEGRGGAGRGRPAPRASRGRCGKRDKRRSGEIFSGRIPPGTHGAHCGDGPPEGTRRTRQRGRPLGPDASDKMPPSLRILHQRPCDPLLKREWMILF